MRSIDLFFDFVSPYSYLAFTQLGTLDAEVNLVPVAILEVMKRVNNTPTTITCPVKRAYAGKDLARWAARYGVPLQSPDFSRLDPGLLLRVVTAAQPKALAHRITATIFGAVWGANGDATPQGLPGLLKAAGLPANDLLAAANGPDAAAALARAVEEASEAGVFGAPTFRVAGDLYFGNDRLDFVREALANQKEHA
jgi:2-hydroxychromene-2-carboxylate isomerase